MVTGVGRGAAQADRAALAEHGLLAPQPELARAAVDHDERAVRRLVGDDEVAVAAEDARVQPRSVLARYHDIVALLPADAHAAVRLDREGVIAVAQLQH